MASITYGGTTFNTTAGSKTVTLTPAVNDLLVVVAASSGLAGGTTAVTDNNSSGTYTQVDADRTGFSTTGVLTIWIRNGLIGSATSTIVTAAQVGSTGGGLTVYRVSGMLLTGSSAARSAGGQSSGTSGTAPAPVLSNTPRSTNPIIAGMACGTNPPAMTPRSSPAYTESSGADAGYNTPPTGMESMWINSGESSATITWGSNAPSTFASTAIELNAPYARTALAGGTGSFSALRDVLRRFLAPGAGSFVASKRVARLASASGTGSLTALRDTLRVASATGTGNLSASRQVGRLASAAGTGNLAALRDVLRVASATGSGAFAASYIIESGGTEFFRAATLGGVGSLAALRDVLRVSSHVGVGVFTASYILESGAYEVDATLSATGRLIARPAVSTLPGVAMGIFRTNNSDRDLRQSTYEWRAR